VLQPSSPYSPKVRSSHPTSTQQQQQQQHYRQADDASATPDGSGVLQCPPSPDPMAAAKLGYAFSFHRSSTAKVRPMAVLDAGRSQRHASG
jgi:hypothetical protein